MTDASDTSAAVAEIDVAALAHNLGLVRSRLSVGTDVMAIVKANAYGHGLPETALRLQALGVTRFGVATPHEALSLRRGGVTGAVLLLSPVYEPEVIRELAAQEVTLTVPGLEAVAAVKAAGPGGKLAVHLKLDTGMGRIGATTPAAAAELAVAAARAPGVSVSGTFTHLHSAEDEDQAATRVQLDRFDESVAAISAAGVDPGARHVANSAAIFGFPDHHLDVVHPGIVLYGYYPGAVTARQAPGLRPAMRLTAPVSFVKRVSPGTTVSYGASWRAERETVVATVRAGYADGYRRSLSGKAQVGFEGRRLNVLGRICMDQLMIDATDVELRIGDRVVLWGPGGPGADEVGESIGTVSYEMLTGVAARVGRRYIEST
ncbi:MAG TPA: alanine racemase [Trueperaceae bacterium]